MRKNHVQRVGKVANPGDISGHPGYHFEHPCAYYQSKALPTAATGFGYVVIGLFMMGLGYGIRYRYKYCLYHDNGVVLVLSCNFLFRLFVHHTSYLTLRFVLCTWVFFPSHQAISSMHVLIATNTFPDKDNRFMRFY